jgi:hypothetical protein
LVVLARLASAVYPTQRGTQEALAVFLETVTLRAVASCHVDAVRSNFVLERSGSALHSGGYRDIACLYCDFKNDKILDRASIARSGILGTIERMRTKKGAAQIIDQEEF